MIDEETELTIPISTIIAATAAAFGVERGDILSARKSAAMVEARHAACALARRLTSASLPDIGQAIGRDHTTVLHAVRSSDRREAVDETYAETLDGIAAACIYIVKRRLALKPGVDPVRAAQRILRNPARNSVQVSSAEAIAMAAMLVDLVELGQGVRELLEVRRRLASGQITRRLLNMNAGLTRVVETTLDALGFAPPEPEETASNPAQPDETGSSPSQLERSIHG